MINAIRWIKQFAEKNHGKVCLTYLKIWTVFNHVMRGRPGGLLQFSGGGAVRIILSSASSICPDKERRRDWIIAEVWLLGCPPQLIIANQLVPLESKKCSQASLIKSINLACIHLGDCPAFRSV